MGSIRLWQWHTQCVYKNIKNCELWIRISHFLCAYRGCVLVSLSNIEHSKHQIKYRAPNAKHGTSNTETAMAAMVNGDFNSNESNGIRYYGIVISPFFWLANKTREREREREKGLKPHSYTYNTLATVICNLMRSTHCIYYCNESIKFYHLLCSVAALCVFGVESGNSSLEWTVTFDKLVTSQS